MCVDELKMVIPSINIRLDYCYTFFKIYCSEFVASSSQDDEGDEGPSTASVAVGTAAFLVPIAGTSGRTTNRLGKNDFHSD